MRHPVPPFKLSTDSKLVSTECLLDIFDKELSSNGWFSVSFKENFVLIFFLLNIGHGFEF